MYRVSLTPLFVSVALLSSLATARAQIDFTPRQADIMIDGVPMHSTYLPDGDRKILFTKPAGWEAKGEAGALCLTSPTRPSARVDIRNSAVKLPPAPDDKWVKLMTPELLKSLPKAAKNAAVVSTKVNPFTLYNWKSFEFLMAYELEGVKYQRGVCFLTVHGKGSIEMVTSGLEQDVSAARAAGLALFTTWSEPLAKEIQSVQ